VAIRDIRRTLLALALVVLVSGCSARATLSVTVRADGSGSAALHVALDAEAVQAAEGGAPLAQRVRLTDLRHAGWTVAPWSMAPNGSASIVLTTSFRTPAQHDRIVGELSGTQGPLRSFAASRDAAWGGLNHTVHVGGLIDLRAARPGVPADAALVHALAAQHVDVSVVEAQLAGELASSVSLRVELTVAGQRHEVTVSAGGRGSVAASSTSLDVGRTVLAGVAILLVGLAGLAWRRGRHVRARRRRQTATRGRRGRAST
jgi:hypothetical protein